MYSNVGINSRCKNAYLERINKVLEYIEVNLDSNLNLNILANVAGFSPYHFHRIFHSIVGYTVQNYVKRIRLASAAHKLLYCPDLSITDIALDSGFSTLSDFSRSFKSEYNMSASNFIKTKKEKCNTIEYSKRIESIPIPEASKLEYLNNIKLVDLPDFNIAYIRSEGLLETRQNPKIEKAFGRLIKWAKAHELINKETEILGITLDNPEITPLEKCRYDACISVPERVNSVGEIGIRKLNSKGRYISCYFHGLGEDTEKKFFDLVLSIYGWWLPENRYLPDNRPFLEKFDFKQDSNNISMEFCIPVKPF